MEKISFVIPCYNYGNKVESCIESCKKINCEKEIIVVNDASTDNTFEVLNKRKDIKFINLEVNKGAGHARNVGAISSKYDNIFFIDSDDVLLEGSNKLIPYLSKYDIIYGDFLLNNKPSFLCEETRINKYSFLEENYLTAVFLTKKKVWKSVKGFPENRDIFEDWAFFGIAAIQNFKFKKVNELTFEYRRSSDGRYSSMRLHENFHKRKTRTYIKDFYNS